MTPNTLIERLRGLIRIPVNDGAGLLDGKDFFERSFPTSNLAREAADRIEALEAQVELRDAVVHKLLTRQEALEAALQSIVRASTAVLLSATLDECPVHPEVLERIIKDANAALAPEQDK